METLFAFESTDGVATPKPLDRECTGVHTMQMSTSAISGPRRSSDAAVPTRRRASDATAAERRRARRRAAASARTRPPAPARVNSSRSGASSDDVLSIEPPSLGSSMGAPRTPTMAWFTRVPRTSSATTVEPAARAVTSPAFGAKNEPQLPKMPDVCFEAAIGSEASVEADDEEGKPLVRGIGARIARALLLGDGRDVRRAHICGDLDLHASPSAGGPDIGFRNVAMMLSSLLPHEQVGDSLRAAGVFDAPAPKEVARLVEAAWKRGYDPRGAASFDNKLTGKWIGAVEVAVLLHSLGLRARVKAFDNRSAIARKRFLDWVFAYFESSSGGANVLVHGTGRGDGGNRRCVAPLFLQWEGHSVTVCGAERTRKGETRILVLDPAAPAADALRGRNLPAKLFLVRRGENHPQLQAPRLQVVFLDQSPLLNEPAFHEMPDTRKISKIFDLRMTSFVLNNGKKRTSVRSDKHVVPPGKRINEDVTSHRERSDTNSSYLQAVAVAEKDETDERAEQRKVGELLSGRIESWRAEAAPPKPVKKVSEQKPPAREKIVKGAESGRRAFRNHNNSKPEKMKKQSKLQTWFCFWVPFFTGYDPE